MPHVVGVIVKAACSWQTLKLAEAVLNLRRRLVGLERGLSTISEAAVSKCFRGAGGEAALDRDGWKRVVVELLEDEDREEADCEGAELVWALSSALSAARIAA